MDTVLRAAVVYLILLVVMQVAGRRTLGQLTAFDFVLLLIISETVQQAMVGDDHSITGAVVAICTLVGLDVALSLLKMRSPQLEKWLEGVPLVVVREGTPLTDLMRRARIDLQDVMKAARENHGIGALSQIRYAVLERDGHISIIPNEGRAPPPDPGSESR